MTLLLLPVIWVEAQIFLFSAITILWHGWGQLLGTCPLSKFCPACKEGMEEEHMRPDHMAVRKNCHYNSTNPLQIFFSCTQLDSPNNSSLIVVFFFPMKPVKTRNDLHLINASCKSSQCTSRRWGSGEQGCRKQQRGPTPLPGMAQAVPWGTYRYLQGTYRLPHPAPTDTEHTL